MKRRGERLLLPILLAASFAACRRGGDSRSNGPAAAAPDQVIGDFTVDNFVKGSREWSLAAPQAFVYEPEKRVELDRPKVRFYEKGRPGARLDAGHGRFRTDTRDLKCWDGVVIISTDNSKLETPWMEYRSVEDLVFSSAPVTVTRGASVLRGVGWEARPDLSRLVVRRQTVEYIEEDK